MSVSRHDYEALQDEKKELEAKVERLQEALQWTRNWLYYSGHSPYGIHIRDGDPHHGLGGEALELIDEDGSRVSAAHYRGETIEAVAEVLEGALDRAEDGDDE